MTLLERAKRYWKAGQPAPLDVAVGLMGMGYEVDRLEDHYMNVHFAE